MCILNLPPHIRFSPHLLELGGSIIYLFYSSGLSGSKARMRAPTAPPHGGAAPSPAKITSVLACHQGPAVRLGHPHDRSQGATKPYADSRAKTLSAPAPRRPFGRPGCTAVHTGLLNEVVHNRSLSVHLRTCSSRRPRHVAKVAASRTWGRLGAAIGGRYQPHRSKRPSGTST